MRTDDIRPLLDRLQAETLAVLDGMKSSLENGPVPARPHLADMHTGLADKMREYQTFKHSRIFDPAVTSGSPSLVEAGRRLKADCIAGGEAFDRYAREWNGKDVVANWPEFRLSTLALGRKIRDHVIAEGVQVRLLLAEAERQGEV